MRILVVNAIDIKKLPPAINLIEALISNGYGVTLITYDPSGITERYKSDIKLIILPFPNGNNFFIKKLGYLSNRFKLRNHINSEMHECDILWTTSDKGIREVGNMIFSYKYVMQLQELVRDVPYPGLKKLPFRLSLKKYAQRAWKVVVPEYNRAHFLKIWFKLDSLPSVFPNKPYNIEYTSESIPYEIKPYIEKIENDKKRKIVYQGCFAKDRNLTPIIDFVTRNADKYTLYIVGFDLSRKDHEVLWDKYCRVEGICVVPFIVTPYYLELTKRADIGILPYFPIKSGNESEFNALYCAPNKIYEYAWCGVPMVGPDIPGLRYPFEQYGIGKVYNENSEVSVKKAIEYVYSHKERMSGKCKSFFKDTDLDKSIKDIIE